MNKDRIEVVETVDDIEIWVCADGKFEMEWHGKIKRNASFNALKKLILKQRTALVVQQLGDTFRTHKTRKEVKLVAFNAKGRAADETGKQQDFFDEFYVTTAEQNALLDDLIQEQIDLNTRWDTLRRSLTSVDKRSFEQLRIEAELAEKEKSGV